MPDTRGWVVLGLFALGFFEIALMALSPALAGVDLFKTVTQATFVSGILLVAAFYFGSSKGSADKDATIATMTQDADK